MFHRNNGSTIMNLGRRKVKPHDTVKTKYQLMIIKRIMLNIFKEIGLSRNKIRNIKLRFGQKREFSNGSHAFILHNKREVVVKRGMNVAETIANISHEIGHEVTTFGKFGVSQNRCNIIGEISAYNFEEIFLKKFNEIKGIEIKTRYGSFWETIKVSPVHLVSQILKDVPLGKFIRKEYKYR